MCYSSSVVTAEGAGGEGRKVPIALGFASPWGQRGAGASRGDGSSWDEPGDISKWSRGGEKGRWDTPLSAPVPAQGSSTGSVWKDKSRPGAI